MSTDEEIYDVYSDDISTQANIVRTKFGLAPFFEDFAGFQIGGLIDLPPEDGELLQKILDQDRELFGDRLVDQLIDNTEEGDP